MNVEKPGERKGDLDKDALDRLWQALKKQPPGPIQTVKRAREARKKATAA
jgi:hypothetical protein